MAKELLEAGASTNLNETYTGSNYNAEQLANFRSQYAIQNMIQQKNVGVEIAGVAKADPAKLVAAYSCND